MTRQKRFWLLVFSLIIIRVNVYAAMTDLASSPLVTSSSNSVYPNIMYLLDDSGSMDWDYLPDWVNDNNPPDYLYKNHDFNGVAYNPAVTYSPPSYFNSDGTVNTSTYPGQTAANTSNWTSVKNDGYGVQFSGTSNLVNNAYAFVMVPGEFCATPAQRSCNTQTSANDSYPYAAKLRWCNSSSLTTCQVSYNQLAGYNYTYVRTPSPSKSTISISGNSSTSISSIKVNGTEILSAATTATSTASTVASRIVSAINACSNKLGGNCGTVGYTASSSGSTVTIVSPNGNTYTPSVTQSGAMTVSLTSFAFSSVPGMILRETITSSVTSYPYPGTTTKASTRTDCAGTTCSYAEEMTNYSNWWGYYRTRMQMMKTAASLAFSTLGSNYRVGYITINANAGGYLPLAQFSATNKQAWYNKFFAAVPGNGTPLRVALSAVGQYYAGKKPTYTSPASGNATSLTDDPIQYSCQQNFTILSTDGYWNESQNPTQLDGSTSIGNQDGAEPRPYNDGSTISYIQSTSQLQETKSQIFQSTSQQLKRVQQIQSSTSNLQKQTMQLQQDVGLLQSQTSQLQGQISYLQKQTSQLQGKTSSLQKQTSQLQGQTSSLQKQISQLQGQSSQLQSQTMQLQKVTYQLQKSTKSGGTWGAWNNVSTCTASTTVQCQYVTQSTVGVSTCTPIAKSTLSPYTVANPVDCNSVVTSSFANASSCSATTTPDSSGYTTQCQYTAWTGTTGLPNCTNTAQSAGPNYIVGTAYRNCGTVVTTAYANASSCNATTTPDSSGYTTQCQYTAWTGTTGLPSCTNTAQSAGPNYTVGRAYRNCGTVVTTAYANASSCNATTTPDSSGYTTQCQYTAWNTVGLPSCTNTAQSAGPNYTVGTAYSNCGTVVTTAYANASSCSTTAIPDSSGYTTQCQYTAWNTVGLPSCMNTAQSAGPNYTVGTAYRNCGTVVTSAYSNASSCSPTTTPDSNGYTIQCQYAWTNNVGSPACSTPVYSGSGYVNPTVYRNCKSAVTSPYVNVSSCSATTTPDSNGYTTQCQYTAWTAYANANGCTPLAPSGSPPYTVGTATQCQTIDTGWIGASSCSVGGSNGQTVTCQTATSGPTLVASCSSQLASGGNNYIQTTCTTSTIEPATGVATCTPDSASAGNNYVTTSCATVTTGPSSVSSCTTQTPSASNNWLTINCSANASGGTSNTLADTAEYYYSTDLRTAALNNCSVSVTSGGTVTTNDVCANNVPKSGSDSASWQHMTTFTLGLGASGAMLYSPSYATATSGDYFDVKNGTLTNTSSGICSWQTTGACNWPVPSSNTQTTIDDLWHAAVDGRGTYYSATDPTSLVVGLSGALAGVSARTGASAAATTSNPNVTSGDNFVFSSTFTTQNWDGELVRQQLDLTTGVVQSTIDWSAQAQLDANMSRNIYFFSSGATNNLKTFAWNNLSVTQQSYFTLPAISTLSQFCVSGVTCLSAATQTPASGANLVAFLRGDRTNEGASTDTTKYYRQRSHILGDIVNAEAVYVKKPMFAYADYGYTDFVTANSTRQGIVYAAANDGMLHAFYAADGSTGIVGGAEAWAYVPSMVMSSMFVLADKNYANQHQYFVDGTPVVADICTAYCATPVPPATSPPAVWKTILIGGFNGGGRGYYALDITDPSTPKALWEFTDTNMGYTYGNPEIAKLADGTWVVFVTSGYNNVSPGDGIGRLYVLNAATGALIRSISTGAGSTSTPSGLARIRAWVDDATVDDTALRVYGGDLLGNLWRFDINNSIPPAGYEAQLLATLKDGSGNVQPITAKPELGSYTNPMVFVGTGKYLGASDLSDMTQQSMYGIKDPLDTTNYGNPRTSTVGHFVQQTLKTTTCPANSPSTICSSGEVVRTSTDNSVNYSVDSGWYFDFPIQGERDNTDPTLALGTLGFTTNVPNSNACNVGGESYRYFLDYRTGGAVSTSTTAVVATKLGNALATRPVYVRLPNNTIVELTRLSDGTTVTSNVPIGSGAGVTKRVSWRELVNDQ